MALGQKKRALKYAQQANKALPKNLDTKSLLSFIQIWNNEYKNGLKTAADFWYNAVLFEEKNEMLPVLLFLLLAKKQYQSVYEYFTSAKGVELQLKERFKPLWYTLMYYMQEEHPNEYLRMGSELEETVQEIIAQVEQMAIEFA